MRRRVLCTVTLVTACSFVRFEVAAAEAGSFTAAIARIRADDLKRHVEVLASDTLEGREAGSRGGKAAGAYLIEQLKILEAPPAGTDAGYFQHFGAEYRNVLVLLAGSDPALCKEHIVVGAHYDHVGYGSKSNSRGPLGRIHNGADDNASGTAGMLELIEAFQSLPLRPRRSLLFAFWDAEEKGLLGSEHWIRHPSVPLDGVRMAVNIDMIGRLRDDTLEVFGGRTAAGLRRLLSEQNDGIGLALEFNWDNERNSDHYPFLEHRIPFLMLHTRKHDDYHRPSDDVDKLNFTGTERVVQFLFRTVFELADRDDLPRFRPACLGEDNGTRERLLEDLPPTPRRLGVSWSRDLESDRIIQLTGVEPGSPAQKAGLQAGDRILQFGLQRAGASDFRELVMAARNPVRVLVERAGREEPLELIASLAGRPRRLGISWREDDAEPNAVVLTRVVAGSAAARAGLAAGDRVYSVGDDPFDSSEAFLTLVGRQEDSVELAAERHGRIRRVELQPLPVSPD